ncbi:MAG: O-antigen ligase family protein [Planctomycetaceae bacterium]|nr:O-antigen ligase family protein [Planctomycetaceae bacterium]
MSARSRKPDNKHDRRVKSGTSDVRGVNVSQLTFPEKTEQRDLLASLGLGRTQNWLIGVVAALTAATLILNGDGLTFEGDNILVALIWSLLATVLLFVRWYRNMPFCFDQQSGQPLTGRLRFRWFDVTAAVFFGWVFVSFVVVWCSGNGSPRAMLTMLAHWGGFAAMFVTWRLLLNDRRMIRGMLLLFVAAIIGESSAAYYHYFYVGPKTRQEYYAEHEKALTANQDAQTPGEQELYKNRVDSIEPLGTYSLTNSLAAVLAPWCVFLCGVALMGRRLCCHSEIGNLSGMTGNLSMRIAIVTLLIAFVGFILMMTNSRSGILATLFGIACLFGSMLAGKVRNPRTLFGGAMAVCLVIAASLGLGLATGGLDRTLLLTATKSFGYRIQYWQSSLQLIVDHPLTGCGIGNFREYYTQYKLPTASETIADPHNLFFEIATNAGLPPLICFVVLLVAAICYAFISKPEEASPESGGFFKCWQAYQPFLTGGLAGIVAAFFYSLTNYVSLSFDLTCFALLGFLTGFFLLLPIIGQTALPLKTLAPFCLAVLTVALLASGGIAFPHVNVTFWFLLVLCFNQASGGGHGVATLPPSENPKNRELQSPAPEARILKPEIFVALCFLALVIVLYPTAWLANLRANTLLRNMEANPSQGMFLDKRITEWEKVVREDPYRTRVWCDLCAAYLLEQREFPGLTQKRPDTSDWQTMIDKQLLRAGITHELSRVTLNGTTAHALANAVRSSPLSASNYQNLGMIFLEDFEKSKNRGSLDLAIAMFQLAATRYPNHSLSYAWLAVCYNLSGETELRHENAKRAIELDDIMPHSDQKLPEELRRSVGLAGRQ